MKSNSYMRKSSLTTAALTLALLPLVTGCSLIRRWDLEHRPDPVQEVGKINYAPAPEKPLALRDAIELALKYNLDTAAKELEHAIKTEAATGAKLGMLPSLSMNFKRTRRSNWRASSSRSFKSGSQSLESSVSSERLTRTYGLHFAWNLVDFGLSYLRARQAEEEARIRENRLLRVRQDLALDVAEAYWKTVMARKAAEKARMLLKKAKIRRATIQRQLKDNRINEVKGLESENTIAQMQVRLKDQSRQYDKAKIRLAKLIGLTPGADYQVLDPKIESIPALPKFNRRELETEALRNRPEISELLHKEQIQQDEVEAKILKMFPNVSLLFDRDHDTNKFLTHRTWHTIGINAAFDLLSLPRKWKDKRTAVRRIDLTRKKRMAVAVGIITQLHLALLDLRDSIEQCREAQDLDRLQQRLLAATLKYRKREGTNESKVLEREAEAFFAHARFLKAYADCMIARERLENTLGRNLKRLAADNPPAVKQPAQGKAPTPESNASMIPAAASADPADRPQAQISFAVPAINNPPELNETAPVATGRCPSPRVRISPSRLRAAPASAFPAAMRINRKDRPISVPTPAKASPGDNGVVPDSPAAEILFEAGAVRNNRDVPGRSQYAMRQPRVER